MVKLCANKWYIRLIINHLLNTKECRFSIFFLPHLLGLVSPKYNASPSSFYFLKSKIFFHDVPIFNYIFSVRVCSYKLNLPDAPPNTACSSTSERRLRPPLGTALRACRRHAYGGLYLRTVCIRKLFSIVDTPSDGRIPQSHIRKSI